METCLQPLWDLLREPFNQLMEVSDSEKNSSDSFQQQMEGLLIKCINILNMFWDELEGAESLRIPEHIDALKEVINISIHSADSIEVLKKNMQHVICEAEKCGLCTVCRRCSLNFYKEFADGKFREKNLPYELTDYFTFKPQMYYYREHMNSTHTRVQIKDSLLLLKGFSSSTPTVHSAVFDSTCLGGGIYINYKGTGIVIDPGIGFVKLMHEHGIYIEDVDAVIITHDHLDHNADAETISSLVYDYNSYNARKDAIVCEVLELGESSKHDINWIMDGDSYDKLKSRVSNSDKLEDYQVEKIFSAGGNNIFLSTIHTHHIRENEETYGIKLRFQYNDEDYTVGYTSDTAYFEELSDFFENVDALIFNVSDIYKKDVKGIKDKKSHLGYNGSLKILNNTKVKMAIASEFCCTNGDFRMNFIRSLKNELEADFRGTLLPGEIGMKVSIPDNCFECSVCKRKVDVSEVHALDSEYDYGKIRYVCSQCML